MNDGRSHPSVARRNLRDVLGTIVLNGPLSRTEISRHTGLHAASVSRITKSLIAADLIRERSEVTTPGKPGRRFIELEVNPEGGYVIGIAINALELLFEHFLGTTGFNHLDAEPDTGHRRSQFVGNRVNHFPLHLHQALHPYPQP